MSGSYDTAYKQLFSHPEFVQQLMEGFAPPGISQRLNYSTLKHCPGNYITAAMKTCFDDIVWSVELLPDDSAEPADKPTTLYLYLLLEFQSTNDATMPLRMLQYTAAFYLELVKQKAYRPGVDPLPPIFPLVLYNGDGRWRAATSLSALRSSLPEPLAGYQPQLTYYLIDEKRLPDDELERHEEPLSSIFSMEKAATSAEVVAAANALVRKAKQHPDSSRLEKMLLDWIKYYIDHQYDDVNPDAIDQLEEVPTMLDIRKELKDAMDAGIQQGVQQGMQEGMQQGMQAERNTAARRLLASGLLTDSQVADLLNLSTSEIQTLKQDTH